MWGTPGELLVFSILFLILGMWAEDDLERDSTATDRRTAWCGSLPNEERPMRRIRKFFKSDLGATAIEYGLIAALIAVVIIAALQLTGNSLKQVFNNVSSNLSSASSN